MREEGIVTAIKCRILQSRICKTWPCTADTAAHGDAGGRAWCLPMLSPSVPTARDPLFWKPSYSPERWESLPTRDRGGSWGSEKLSNLPRLWWWRRDQTQVWLPRLYSFYSVTWPPRLLKTSTTNAVHPWIIYTTAGHFQAPLTAHLYLDTHRFLWWSTSSKYKAQGMRDLKQKSGLWRQMAMRYSKAERTL